jgi:predicted lipoprotein with Yx(FWY)xxD motif
MRTLALRRTTRSPRLWRRTPLVVGSLTATMAMTFTAPAIAHADTTTSSAAGGGTMISVVSSPYGEALAVGAGQFAGYTVYQFDRNTPGACTTTAVRVQNNAISCTGPMTDTMTDWPAVTTTGKPVAGPGVQQRLLGTVYRKDIGADQVTYAGKLLYLFDPKPNMFTGANFMETALPLPPWHGVWWLVSPKDGHPVTGPLAVTIQKQADGATVLAADMFQGQGTTAVVVYADSKDPKDHSTCTGSCALLWMPVLTSAPALAGPGISSKSLGEIKRSGGTKQLTFKGKPLYFYSEEVPQLNPTTGNPLDPATIGTGNGRHGPAHFGGTFTLVSAAGAT